MTNEQLKEKILSVVTDATFEDKADILTAIVPAAKLKTLAQELRNQADTDFDYLYCISGVDYPSHIFVVYHFESIKHKHQVALKAKIDDRQNPVVDTVCYIWRTAEFHEREVYDFFGVKFTGHPDMRRLFMPDDWNGYPLRKDYVDEVNIIER